MQMVCDMNRISLLVISAAEKSPYIDIDLKIAVRFGPINDCESWVPRSIALVAVS